ncbi:pyruvate kinase [Roseomonas sp. E05]|uniref:pyruvate kinase n=1 Tax=Roseomonas sp. E05 TaxID=3046310 RepID=UPI0024BB6FC6|nr:pyruvate kinase [Roseomonas sp. E05]MDJ0388396.1 pyruvate kinase [Roseomonas sp. E05]
MDLDALPEIAGLAPMPAALHGEVEALIAALRDEGADIAKAWSGCIERPEFLASAINLSHYLALRHRDLRPLQRPLMALGLSSLGRLESRVLPALEAVRATLATLAGLPAPGRPTMQAFFAGERRLARNTAAVLGPATPNRPIGLLVTCPSEAANDPAFMRRLAECGVEAVRINCAHDDATVWARMIGHARAAQEATGRRLRILMDLAGPKIRTGAVQLPEGQKRIGMGALLAIVPPGGLGLAELPEPGFVAECTLTELFGMVQEGQRLFVDDGKIGARIERVLPWGLLARVTAVPEEGAKLKPERGLNFPDTDLHCAALTAKDRADLDFVAQHADGIGYSFVQSAADVELLQEELAARRPQDWRALSLILKIETVRAVHALPGIVVQAAGRQPTAIMIARGDLAVEIGFARMAEMQEEILWIGEAAHVPVIWATQVLEHLIRKGTPLRGEMTDAAMAARAECVMLNKGPHLFEAIGELDRLLRRMGEHQRKKTPQLRRLASW